MSLYVHLVIIATKTAVSRHPGTGHFFNTITRHKHKGGDTDKRVASTRGRWNPQLLGQ
jgi:hypothetical protein